MLFDSKTYTERRQTLRDKVGNGILIFLGIVADPTTAGLNDSDRAMQYEDPRE